MTDKNEFDSLKYKACVYCIKDIEIFGKMFKAGEEIDIDEKINSSWNSLRDALKQLKSLPLYMFFISDETKYKLYLTAERDRKINEIFED